MQRNSVRVLLNSFANKPRLGKNENALQYWEQFKESKRELHEFSQVVLAVQTTQVSVERAFSSLKYILSPLRTSMSEQLLENILLIRRNHLQYFSNKSVHFMFFVTCQYVKKNFF